MRAKTNSPSPAQRQYKRGAKKQILISKIGQNRSELSATMKKQLSLTRGALSTSGRAKSNSYQ
jgi:hypothetical protein